MGVIKRQGIKQSMVTLAATLIGAVNLLIIYPIVLEPNELGLLGFLIATAGLFAPFIGLGHQTFAIRFFPEFNDGRQKNHGFLGFSLLGLLVGFLVFVPIFLFFVEDLRGLFPSASPLSAEYFHYTIAFAILILLQTFLTSYISNYKRIVIPSILIQHAKITQPLLAFLYWFNIISIGNLVNGLLFSFMLSVVCLLIYLRQLGGLDFSLDFAFLNRKRLKGMYTFALYSILAGLGSVLATRIDFVMVSLMVSEHHTGVYMIAAFIAGVVEIPLMALNKITAPIISESFKNNDLAHVESLYKKSGLNLLIFGLGLFLLITLGIDNLFMMIRNGDIYAAGKNVILLLGAAKLFDIVTSVNGYIIGYSKYFRFNFYAMLILAALNIVTNYIFITQFQMSGAALATFFTVVIFNVLKGVYIWYRFKMQPFTPQTAYLLIIGLLCFVPVYLLPETSIPFLNIVIKSIIFGGMYTYLVYRFDISEDFNSLVEKGMGMIYLK